LPIYLSEFYTANKSHFQSNLISIFVLNCFLTGAYIMAYRLDFVHAWFIAFALEGRVRLGGKGRFWCAAFKGDAIVLPFWKIDYYNMTIFSAVP